MKSSVLMIAALVTVAQLPLAAQSALNLSPSRVVGQPAVSFNSTSPNVVEGREFLSPFAAVVDRSANPPALYVSDFGNNRVLAWKDSRNFTNGAQADIVIGQLDFTSTFPLGPGTQRTTGLSRPGALAVDNAGNLYVVDTGNNRILRFPKPFSYAPDLRLPDFVIGQPNLSASAANNGGISEKTIAVSSGGTIGRTGLIFDPQGNLWFSDALNNRVLRYPAAALSEGKNQPAADLVLGQSSFTTVTSAPAGDDPRMSKAFLRSPSGIAMDPEGRLFIADALGRVLLFTAPFFSSKEAVRILGFSPRIANEQGQYTTQPGVNEYLLANPEGLVMIGNRLGVVDQLLNRIVIYDPAAEWPAETQELLSPPAKVVLGQQSFTTYLADRGLAEPNESSFDSPLWATFSSGELFVVDSNNHRVLVFPQQVTGAAATRVLGQMNFNLNAPNMVDGRELFLFNGYGATGLSDGGGLAIDNSSDPPRLYVADTYNNRVLGYSDARKVKPGDRADIVIGQNDFSRVLVNAPFNDRDSLNDSGLFRPSGLAVDKNGDLFVADSGNGRVLRFPSPFKQTVPDGERRRANLVLGQLSFAQRITDPSSRNMAYPFGLAFTGGGDLVVSDASQSRLLYFTRPANGDFSNGQAAERVIGQPDFFTIGAGSAGKRMNSPRHVAIDTDDRLYVVDAGNARVLVYDRITVVGNDPAPAFVLTGLTGPQGIFVSALTGEIWVADARGNRAVRFPRYERLAIDTKADYSIPAPIPLAITQDAYGNLYMAEGSNRVAIHFNALTYQIAGNYSVRPLSPGTIALIYPAGAGVRFSEASKSFDQLQNPLPLPRELNDVQVLLDGQAVPLYFVSPLQINVLVPMSAPNSGTAELTIIRPSTGQVVAAGTVPFDRVSPALFTANGSGEGQLAALNEDNTVNSADNRLAKGKVIQLFGTGQGYISKAPPDGTPPTGPVPIEEVPLRVVIGTDFVKDEDILYSGLAPGLVGVWQINVRVPDNVAPSAAVPVAVQLRSVPSTFPNPNSERRLLTTIAVKPQ